MSSSNESQTEAISLFCGITGADEDRARSLLEACDWNLELAINMHVDTDPEGRSNRNGPQPNPSSSASLRTGSNAPQPNHDSAEMDEDGEEGNDTESAGRLGRFATRNNRSINHRAIRRFGAGTSSPDNSDPSNGAWLYNDLQPDSDGVRPPIAPVRQILNPNPIGFPSPDVLHTRRSTRQVGGLAPDVQVFDAFRDFQAEANYQEMLQGEGEEAAATSGRMTLQQLFRPPLELMFRGSLTSAREAGQEQNKWLLVNIQDGSEFKCQVLNRDVWSHQAVKDIIKGNFIFWQVYHDTYEGQRYVQFYNVPVSRLPHVAIIDPRTGELMKSWPASIDHTTFCDSVTEYLLDHPSPDGTSGDANSIKKIRFKEDAEVNGDDDDEPQTLASRTTLYDQSEEAQLEAAIRASLRENEKADTGEETIEIDEDTISVSSDQNKSSTNNHNNASTSKTQEPHKTIADALGAMAETRNQVKIEGPECKIALRFPDGSSLLHKFAASDKLKDVKDFVQMERSTFKSSQIEFVAPPNRKFTMSMMDETLEGLGLCPASRLEVKCVQD